MRAVTRYLYKFDELSEKAKDRAIEDHRQHNLDYDWWDTTYEDAKNIGLEITEFDDYRAKGKMSIAVEESIKQILKDHGEICDTYKLAKEYLKLWNAENCTFILENGGDEYYEESDELQEDYLKALLKLYHKMLMEEAEYLQSDESIIESIQCNEYEFDEYGDLI